MQSLRMRQAAFRPAAAARRPVVAVRASAVAAPAKLPVKGVDGSDKGTEELALKVAGETARSLVHRYLIMAQQNARAVRKPSSRCMGAPTQLLDHRAAFQSTACSC